MAVLEAILIIIGMIFILGSFFVTEKFSQKDIQRASEQSSQMVDRMVEKEMEAAKVKVKDIVADTIDDSMHETQRKLDKETNEKMMAIQEYSDTVVEAIRKNHEEVVFLYSMLNDKKEELGDFLKQAEERKEEKVFDIPAVEKESLMTANAQGSEVTSGLSLEKKENETEETEYHQEELELGNNNQKILDLYQQGNSQVEIARTLGLGLGEVKLVIELYKTEEKVHS